MQSAFRAVLPRCACYRSYSTRNVVRTLEQRGLLAALTSQTAVNHLDRPRTVYLGVDPSADSLHVGNLVALIVLIHFQLHGHRPIALVGGFTGAIGDPSGKSKERVALEVKTLAANVASITAQYKTLMDRGIAFASSKGETNSSTSSLQVVNNADWLGSFSLLDFLSGPGKLSRVGQMLSREAIKSRLESSSGISFTEFTYNLLQAYDFLHLLKTMDCSIQLGGSDQYGNIMAGIDLIRKDYTVRNAKPPPAYGVTLPLLTTASGVKFGKSAGNAVWLDPRKTTSFDLFQFFLQTGDADLRKYLKIFTFLPLQEIEEILKAHASEPDARYPQKVLAGEVVELVHGADERQKAEFASKVIFHKNPCGVCSAEQLLRSLSYPRVRVLDRQDVIGAKLEAVIFKLGWFPSQKQIRIMIMSGSFYLNGKQLTTLHHVITPRDLWDGEALLMRSGKRIIAIHVVDPDPDAVDSKGRAQALMDMHKRVRGY